MRRSLLLAVLLLSTPQAVPAAERLVVHASQIQDQKAVVATVEPVHQLVARARLGGTIVSLKAREGDRADAGAELATVADPKLLLQMQALESRIQSQQSQADKAKDDFDRVVELQRRGVSTQVQVDAAKTALDVAQRTLEAMRSDRSVIAQQMSEGAVLAPAAGRVLSVPVSEGRVVLPGETIATLAEDRYVLRLQLPERHAQFMRAGDKVLIGSRGLGEGLDENKREGRVRIVYPEIQGGRVIADVDVEGLGDYFVGERTRVYVNTGARRAIVIPRSYVFRRAGVNYVKTGDGAEVVVQPGAQRDDGVEILSGLTDGDVLAAP
jgi:multidrug efflux system membrane fusion protein